jgi:hypothetical protein
MTKHPPDRYSARTHRARTDRNLLIGFFVLLFLVGGGLIWYFYGAPAAALGLACLALGALLVGLLALLMTGLERLSNWWDDR